MTMILMVILAWAESAEWKLAIIALKLKMMVLLQPAKKACQENQIFQNIICFVFLVNLSQILSMQCFSQSASDIATSHIAIRPASYFEIPKFHINAAKKLQNAKLQQRWCCYFLIMPNALCLFVLLLGHVAHFFHDFAIASSEHTPFVFKQIAHASMLSLQSNWNLQSGCVWL